MVGKRRGFTLVELLVAMALSLVIILAVTQVFRLVGDNVLAGRAVVEMAGQLRSAADQLQQDLGGLTVPVRPWPETSSGAGYFEYYEGPSSDQNADGDGYIDVVVLQDVLDNGLRDRTSALPTSNIDTTLGDLDDILAFTSQTHGSPFVGQIMGQLVPIPNTRLQRVILDKSNLKSNANPYGWDLSLPDHTIITSQVAEVIWWMSYDDWNGNGSQDTSEPFVLRRQARLVRPDIVFSDPGSDLVLDYLFNNHPSKLISAFDLSISFFSGRPVSNSLSDLTNRQNRFAHIPIAPNGFPYPLDRLSLVKKIDWSDTIPGINGNRDYLSEGQGSDIILSHGIAFDVRAFDPEVGVRTDSTTSEALLPGDPAYGALLLGDPDPNYGQPLSSPIPGVRGGYVDLFYSRQPSLAAWAASSSFSRPPDSKSQLDIIPGGPIAAYDTWSMAYEHDSNDQDRVLGDTYGPDQGTNGIDDNGINGVDDVTERETSPPYPVPLRGIQVRLRIIDRDTRQVRQMTVSSDFIPE